jgi:hypothetical protein
MFPRSEEGLVMAPLALLRRTNVVRLTVLLWLAWIVPLRGALAQGVLVNINPGESVALPRRLTLRATRPPAPPQTYKIKELSVETRLVDQVASTQVNQTFVNTGSAVMEVSAAP